MNLRSIEADFFADALTRAPGSVDAIKRLRALREHPTHDFRVEFHLPSSQTNGDHSMLVYVNGVDRISPGSSLLRAESGGRLMLMNNNHSITPAVVAELGRLTAALNWDKDQAADDSLPTFRAGQWESQVGVIVTTLERIVEKSMPATPVGPTRRRAARTEPRKEEVLEPVAGPADHRSGGVATPALDATSGSQQTIDAAQVRDVISNKTPERRLVERLDRPDQAILRAELLAAYREACCVTGKGPAEALVAAHIEPHASGGSSSLQNGLLMRADLHMLFDANVLRIDPETLRVWIDPIARDAYEDIHGERLLEPEPGYPPPSKEQLAKLWWPPPVE